MGLFQVSWRAEIFTFRLITGPVSHHQSIVAGKNMYLIGGCMHGREYSCSQMYRLDLQSFNWDLVGTKGGEEHTPSGSIDEHTAILDGN